MVPTTAGPVRVSDLGMTLVHEHLIAGPEGMRAQWPHLFDAEAERAACVTEVERAAARGVRTICDPGVLDIGRDVRLNLAVTAATGVRFVMATGAYGIEARVMSTFPWHRGALLGCFLHDLKVGIQGTDVRAGFLKVAADSAGLTSDSDFLHRAVAQASLATGAPIMAHSNPQHGTGLDQMRVFLEEGVDPGKVQMAHTGDTDDLGYVEELLATGCYVGMDRYGFGYGPDTAGRNAVVAALVARGHGARMMLGQDSSVLLDGRTAADRMATAPDSHMTFVLDEVLPALVELGVAPEQLDAMVGANVHAWLGQPRDRG